MKCPNCNIEMYNSCCMRCGYMSNGNYIGKSNTIDKFEDLKIYNNSFDEMVRNNKEYKIFFLGSLYFSYRNHLITGCLVSILDLLISTFIINRFNDWFAPYSPIFFLFMLIAYIFINRVLYMIVSNPICLKLDNLKIKKLKKKYRNYKDIISTHEDKTIFKLLLNIILYIVIFLVALIYKCFENGILHL